MSGIPPELLILHLLLSADVNLRNLLKGFLIKAVFSASALPFYAACRKKYGKYGKYGNYGNYGNYGKYGSYGQYGSYGNYSNSHYGNANDNSIKK